MHIGLDLLMLRENIASALVVAVLIENLETVCVFMRLDTSCGYALEGQGLKSHQRRGPSRILVKLCRPPPLLSPVRIVSNSYRRPWHVWLDTRPSSRLDHTCRSQCSASDYGHSNCKMMFSDGERFQAD